VNAFECKIKAVAVNVIHRSVSDPSFAWECEMVTQKCPRSRPNCPQLSPERILSAWRRIPVSATETHIAPTSVRDADNRSILGVLSRSILTLGRRKLRHQHAPRRRGVDSGAEWWTIVTSSGYRIETVYSIFLFSRRWYSVPFDLYEASGEWFNFQAFFANIIDISFANFLTYTTINMLF
jgi:hypothetical protein